ncbi:hypothetical protein O6P43_004889 [Quillaja saponaria]|uniref:Uncharacterized protein n=1 Tax=Quillaja saponaria TaxID=32244 RepID=A0AAD7VGM4_QUISA|nr:hypothetical protein O6P43_004889 [Quillaja saponaria]
MKYVKLHKYDLREDHEPCQLLESSEYRTGMASDIEAVKTTPTPVKGAPRGTPRMKRLISAMQKVVKNKERLRVAYHGKDDSDDLFEGGRSTDGAAT